MGLITVGLDISLTRTGAVALEDGTHVLDHLSIPTSSKKELEERIEIISTPVVKFLKRYKPDLTVMEGGARGKVTDIRVYHLAGVVRWRLWRREILVEMVAPNTLKLDGAGHGHAGKPQMLAAARLVWPDCPNHDVADAFHAARWGYRNYARLVEVGE